MDFISANIVRFADPRQPVWVKREFLDAAGPPYADRPGPDMHSRDVRRRKRLPCPGQNCPRSVRAMRRRDGPERVSVTTAKSWDTDSADGFVRAHNFRQLGIHSVD